MKTTRFVVTSVAALLLALSATKEATADATITISGSVGLSSCTVVLTPTVVNLGNHLQGAFSTPRTPLVASQQNFSISLDSCAGTVASGAELTAIVMGFNISGDNDIFIPSGSSGNVGVRLTAGGSPINNNSVLTLGTTTGDDSFDIPPLLVTAALISTAATSAEVSTGNISVPVTFSYLAP